MVSRVGLRQLVVLLVLTSLLVAAGNMFWASSSLHQQALREHDLQRQLGFAQQLAGRLQARSGKEPLRSVLGGLLMDDQLRVWVIEASGQPSYPAASQLTPSQQQALQKATEVPYSAMVRDEQGREQMTSVIRLADTGRLLLVQTPASGQAPSTPNFADMLIYSMPAAVLLMVLAWLAGGSMARPFRTLANSAKTLGKPETLTSIEALQPSSREAAELKHSLLQGVKQIKGGALAKPEDGLDPLTGLCTPDILPELVANISLGGTSFSVVVLAVDDYEQIQEHFTPALRNQALQQLAQLLLQHSRELDISVRMGEEVFLLLLPQCPVVIAQRIAERLRGKVQDSPFNGVGHMTISAGVAMFEPGKNDPLGSLKQAQQLLISARRQGQNRVHVIP